MILPFKNIFKLTDHAFADNFNINHRGAQENGIYYNFISYFIIFLYLLLCETPLNMQNFIPFIYNFNLTPILCYNNLNCILAEQRRHKRIIR
ncbi:hypothetical protein CSTERLE_01055 [Thermoclostridium stercorarium subsp. leptospartum DSM 9219]|uniref:Uncharacterized protein n=1 Tax=Thermoclostridium stercorarium subsp. leptospartum DSM 9219 TaxID=1346611 RepID=A0A1B1YHM6_THEST|nr:hypothetical protein CSTERLE_01055 [Thermoclostridium stercorarium subsp. leptospartum DSM 9219]